MHRCAVHLYMICMRVCVFVWLYLIIVHRYHAFRFIDSSSFFFCFVFDRIASHLISQFLRFAIRPTFSQFFAEERIRKSFNPFIFDS